MAFLDASASHEPFVEDAGGLVRLVAVQRGADVAASEAAEGDGTDARFFSRSPANFVVGADAPLALELRRVDDGAVLARGAVEGAAFAAHRLVRVGLRRPDGSPAAATLKCRPLARVRLWVFEAFLDDASAGPLRARIRVGEGVMLASAESSDGIFGFSVEMLAPADDAAFFASVEIVDAAGAVRGAARLDRDTLLAPTRRATFDLVDAAAAHTTVGELLIAVAASDAAAPVSDDPDDLARASVCDAALDEIFVDGAPDGDEVEIELDGVVVGAAPLVGGAPDRPLRFELPVDDAALRRLGIRVYAGGECVLGGYLSAREALRGSEDELLAPRTIRVPLASPHRGARGREGAMTARVTLARRARVRLCEARGLPGDGAFCASVRVGDASLGETRALAGGGGDVAWYDRFDLAVPAAAVAGEPVFADVFRVGGDGSRDHAHTVALAPSAAALAAAPGIRTHDLGGGVALKVHVSATDFRTSAVAARRMAVDDKDALDGVLRVLETRLSARPAVSAALALLRDDRRGGGPRGLAFAPE